MDVPPHLRGEMASLAAAGRLGDAAEIRRLLPGLYETLAAALRNNHAATGLEDTLRRLKAALDAGDGQGIDTAMDSLRDMDDLSAEARELYCFLNDALLMDETEEAVAKLNEWAAKYH
jgi:hypothetical protein